MGKAIKTHIKRWRCRCEGGQLMDDDRDQVGVVVCFLGGSSSNSALLSRQGKKLLEVPWPLAKRGQLEPCSPSPARCTDHIPDRRSAHPGLAFQAPSATWPGISQRELPKPAECSDGGLGIFPLPGINVTFAPSSFPRPMSALVTLELWKLEA